MSDGDRDPDEERASAGDEMSSRLASRFDQSDDQSQNDVQPSQADEAVKSSEPSESSSSKAAQTGMTSVKDRPSVLMYLPEDLHEDLDIRFDELNARHKREHGEAIEKNRDYYPAVIKAALERNDLEDILDL